MTFAGLFTYTPPSPIACSLIPKRGFLTISAVPCSLPLGVHHYEMVVAYLAFSVTSPPIA